jgi:hypothetical protein
MLNYNILVIIKSKQWYDFVIWKQSLESIKTFFLFLSSSSPLLFYNKYKVATLYISWVPSISEKCDNIFCYWLLGGKRYTWCKASLLTSTTKPTYTYITRHIFKLFHMVVHVVLLDIHGWNSSIIIHFHPTYGVYQSSFTIRT